MAVHYRVRFPGASLIGDSSNPLAEARRFCFIACPMLDLASQSAGDPLHLLGADDPPPFEVLNADGSASVLLICDHASRVVPGSLDNLGLDADAMGRHIAWDIGAEAVARRLSARLDAAAVLCGYSRLVIDVNRQPGDPQSIPPVSDEVSVPANQGLSEFEQQQRIDAIFWPYHQAVTAAQTHLWRRGSAPALFSVHTFTPSLAGEDREWDIGVLWNRDPRLSVPLIEALRAAGDFNVGDNEPYSGREIAYSIDLHGDTAGFANCAVEIRQDLVEDDDGAEHWARVLDAALGEILPLDALHRIEHF
jgi:predicted N-formylglutamate amidohydrolase